MNHEWNCNCEDCCWARGGEICPTTGALVTSCSCRAEVKENWDSVPPYLPQLMNLPKTFTVTCHMKEKCIPQFLALLKYMEYLGHVGSTRSIEFYSDGDGEFKPKFIWDESLPTPAKYVRMSLIHPPSAPQSIPEQSDL